MTIYFYFSTHLKWTLTTNRGLILGFRQPIKQIILNKFETEIELFFSCALLSIRLLIPHSTYNICREREREEDTARRKRCIGTHKIVNLTKVINNIEKVYTRVHAYTRKQYV